MTVFNKTYFLNNPIFLRHRHSVDSIGYGYSYYNIYDTSDNVSDRGISLKQATGFFNFNHLWVCFLNYGAWKVRTYKGKECLIPILDSPEFRKTFPSGRVITPLLKRLAWANAFSDEAKGFDMSMVDSFYEHLIIKMVFPRLSEEVNLLDIALRKNAHMCMLHYCSVGVGFNGEKMAMGVRFDLDFIKSVWEEGYKKFYDIS